MKNTKTVYVFLVLILVTWVLELGLGWKLMEWFFNASWFGFSTPGSKPFAVSIASWGHFTLYGSDGTAGRVVDLHLTPLKVMLFFYGVFVAIHVVAACWNGLLRPFFQRWNQGVRFPIGRERQRFEATCAVIARNSPEPIARPHKWLVHDGGGLDMRWHGYRLIIDRELLTHRYFAPLLAVQLAHANSEDRLARRLYAMLPPVGVICGALVGWPFALGHVLTFPAWMWYWKERVYAADAFAVEHGQGPALVQALDRLYLRADTATRGGRFLKPAPYIAQRIGRIQQLLQSGMNQGQRVI